MDARRAAEIAERLAWKKSVVLWLQGLLFVVWQGNWFLNHPGEPERTVEKVQIAAWFVWAVALLIPLFTGGGWIWSREVRRLLNDELAVHNRHAAQRAGFVGAAAASLLVYGLSFYEPLGARDAVHLILTLTIGAALFRHAWLERRSGRGE